jgi:hypothetical protein
VVSLKENYKLPTHCTEWYCDVPLLGQGNNHTQCFKYGIVVWIFVCLGARSQAHF